MSISRICSSEVQRFYVSNLQSTSLRVYGIDVVVCFGSLISFHIDPGSHTTLYAVLSFLLAVTSLRESLEQEDRAPFDYKRLNPISALMILFVKTPPRAPTFVFSLLLLSASCRYGLLFLYTTFNFHWSQLQYGYLMLSTQVLSGLVSGVGIHFLVERYGEVRTLSIGVALQGVGFIIVAIACKQLLDDGWMLYLGLGLGALGGSAVPGTRALVSKAVKVEDAGGALGALGSLEALMCVVGPMLFSQVYSHTIDIVSGSPFFIAGGIMIVGVWVTEVYVRQSCTLVASSRSLRTSRVSKGYHDLNVDDDVMTINGTDDDTGERGPLLGQEPLDMSSMT
jgi:hypothetical protein